MELVINKAEGPSRANARWTRASAAGGPRARHVQADAPRHHRRHGGERQLDPAVLGYGIAAKLSQRLGEGVLNGLLTARLGLAAIDVTRPLPFTALPRPALADLAKDLLRKRGGEE